MSKEELIEKINEIFDDLNKYIDGSSLTKKNEIINFSENYREFFKKELKERKMLESEIINIEENDKKNFINYYKQNIHKKENFIEKKLEENDYNYKKTKEALGIK